MLRALAAALLVAPSGALVHQDADASCEGPQAAYADFLRKYRGGGRDLGADEYKMREAIFYSNSGEVRDHNCGSNSRGFRKAVNRFSDWTQQELMNLHGYSVESEAAARARAVQRPATLRLDSERERFGLADSEADLGEEELQTAETWTWEDLEAIKGETDQGHCGSCWAVAGETIMRAHSEVIGRPRKFSVDTLISCTPNPKQCGGTGGCHGATAALTYEYATNYGLPLREEEAMEIPMAYFGDVQDCPARYTPTNMSFASDFVETKYGHLLHRVPRQLPKIKGGEENVGGFASMGMYGWLKIARNRIAPLKYALVNMGPMSVSIAVTPEWHMYSSGIMPGCGSNRVSVHGITLFGYGKTDADELFWQLKNSWGNDWGENGHIRLARQSDEEEQSNCGWNREPHKGSGCNDGPAKVWVCGTCDILFDGAMPLFKDPNSLRL